MGFSKKTARLVAIILAVPLFSLLLLWGIGFLVPKTSTRSMTFVVDVSDNAVWAQLTSLSTFPDFWKAFADFSPSSIAVKGFSASLFTPHDTALDVIAVLVLESEPLKRITWRIEPYTPRPSWSSVISVELSPLRTGTMVHVIERHTVSMALVRGLTYFSKRNTLLDSFRTGLLELFAR